MTFDEAVKFFGSQYKLANGLGVSHATVTNWKHQGFIPDNYQPHLDAIINPPPPPEPIDPAVLDGLVLSLKKVPDPQRQKLWNDGTLFRDDQGRTMLDVSKLFLEDDTTQGPQS